MSFSNVYGFDVLYDNENKLSNEKVYSMIKNKIFDNYMIKKIDRPVCCSNPILTPEQEDNLIKYRDDMREFLIK